MLKSGTVKHYIVSQKGKKKCVCLHSETNLSLSNRGRAVHILSSVRDQQCLLECVHQCVLVDVFSCSLQVFQYSMCMLCQRNPTPNGVLFTGWHSWSLLHAIIMSVAFAIQRKNWVLGSQPSIGSASKKKASGLTS